MVFKISYFQFFMGNDILSRNVCVTKQTEHAFISLILTKNKDNTKMRGECKMAEGCRKKKFLKEIVEIGHNKPRKCIRTVEIFIKGKWVIRTIRLRNVEVNETLRPVSNNKRRCFVRTVKRCPDRVDQEKEIEIAYI